LASRLQTNKKLQVLGLRGNKAGDDGTTALAQALTSNNALQVLFLGDNGVTDAAAPALASGVQGNKALLQLGLLSNPGLTDAGIAQIQAAVALRCPLTILHDAARVRPTNGGKREVSGRFEDVLNQIRNGQLVVVQLESLNLGDSEAAQLAAVLKNDTVVQEVWLNDNVIGVAGAGSLATMLLTNSNLQVLGARGNKFGDDGTKALAQALPRNKVLQVLFLGDNGLTDTGATLLAAGIGSNQALNQLGLLDNVGITSAGIAQIQKVIPNRAPLTILHDETAHEETAAQRA